MRSRLLNATLVISVIVLLSFSFLQAVPVTTAQAAGHDTTSAKVPQGFKLKGAAPGPLTVLASIAIPLRNLDLLTSLVKEVSDPTSPMFGHYFTDQQIAQDFLPTAQYASMMQYLSMTPLRVESTALDSMIVVQGTASQMSEYLGTAVNMYSNGTYSYYMSSSGNFHGAYLYASNSTGLFAKPALASVAGTKANVTFTSGGFSAKLLPQVYNATGLYAKGFNGTGKTIGLMDFFGSPTVGSDLRLFDQQYGFPDPLFQIMPIGPYDPNIGAFTGWSTEIALDVELSHAMAPAANVDLYIANGALTQADVIAQVVKDNKVNTLSQSYTFAEWAFSYNSPGALVFNVLLPEVYYQLGALKGITFVGSTGDTGGSGFTSGTEGELGYPASSPYVTAVGATQTYFSGSSYVQTAWSNIGFVPNGVNYGGTTGGVSILEPEPWYQSIFPTPASYPNGRMNPDLAVQGAVDPGTFIVDSSKVTIEGGTSQSSPMFAGLVALIDQYVGSIQRGFSGVGLINPFLYQLANDPTNYPKTFTQIKFGYIVPWVATAGYNLVTGLGSPNIGEIAALYAHSKSQASLNITVALSPGSDTFGWEHNPGTTLTIGATITGPSGRVVSGGFTATVVTLKSQTPVTLAYNSGLGLWTGRLTITSQSGIAYVQVQGASGGVSGAGMASFFAGYVGVFYSPLPTDPWSTVAGLSIIVQSLTLDGALATQAPIQVEADSYSIITNQYRNVGTFTLTGAIDPVVGPVDAFVAVNASWPTGPMTLVLQGSTYGYLVFVNGVYLQTSFIYSQVAAEPGSVAAGGQLTIVASPVAPFNLYDTISMETGSLFGSDLQSGSNVTAFLVDRSGNTLSTGHLAYQPCREAIRVCGGGATNINGYLTIPSSINPGLYTILLTSNYSSYTFPETVSGSFFSQIWVSQAPLTPKLTVLPGPVGVKTAEPPATQTSLFQGQTAHVEAQIAYPNGTAVKYGEYTAAVYPQQMASDYGTLIHDAYANGGLTSLVYNPTIGAWVGNMTLPSPYNSGVLSLINNNSFFYSGPYDAYVTGITADGFVTTSAISAQQPFFIQPYVYMTGTVSSAPQTSGLVFSGATIKSAGSLTGDLFLGSNTLSGATVSIVGSQIQGTLTIANSRVTLTGVSGGDVTATNSNLVLVDSSLGTLTLTGSNATLSNSSFQHVSPAQAAIAFGPLTSQPASGRFPVTAAITGQLLAPGGIAMWVDGTQVTPTLSTTPTGLTATASLDASAMADGVHTVTLTATQTDGISASASVFVTTNSHIAGLNSSLQQANQLIGQQGSEISNLTAKVQSNTQQLGTVMNFAYGLSAVAVIGVAIAVMALRRKPPMAGPPS